MWKGSTVTKQPDFRADQNNMIKPKLYKDMEEDGKKNEEKLSKRINTIHQECCQWRPGVQERVKKTQLWSALGIYDEARIDREFEDIAGDLIMHDSSDRNDKTLKKCKRCKEKAEKKEATVSPKAKKNQVKSRVEDTTVTITRYEINLR